MAEVTEVSGKQTEMGKEGLDYEEKAEVVIGIGNYRLSCDRCGYVSGGDPEFFFLSGCFQSKKIVGIFEER